MIDLKTRLLAIAGSLILLLLVVDLVRRRKLKEEYSVLWVLAATVLLVLAAWYQLLGWITRLIGGVTLSSTLFFFALLFVFFMLLHYSVRISAMERRLTALVQELGLLGVALPVPERPAPPDTSEYRADTPLCSVIIPCFNDGAFVREAVDSIKEPGPVEIIVVDDGSDDPETLATLEDLNRHTDITVAHRENRGPGAARTSGLELARAEFIYPLDADDVLEPGALAAMATTLTRHSEAGFTWGDYREFGNESGYYRAPERWLPWTLTFVNPYPVCSMFRRSVLEQAGGWSSELRSYEDWDLWLRMAGANITGVRTDMCVYRRRIHGDNRLLPRARRQHAEFYERLRRQHLDIFARRAVLRRQERPARWKLLVFPVIFGVRRFVPLSIETGLKRIMMRRGTGLP